MSDQAVPILVYHHVYPEAAPELESATGDNAAGIIGLPMQPLELTRWEEGAESETGLPPTDEDLRNLCRNHRSLVFASSDSFPPSPEIPPAPSAGSTGCRTTNPGRPC